jgi:hypothetical protein
LSFSNSSRALREHRELHGFADIHPSGGRGQRPVDDAQQRRFARAVRPHDAEAVARADQPRHVVENHAAADTHAARRRSHIRVGVAIDIGRRDSVIRNGIGGACH